MATFNKVIIMGNLVRDPDLRTTPSGTKVASMTLAVSEVWKDKTGQSQERTCFVDVEVWNRGQTGRLAELCAQYLSKGRSALVEGKLEQHNWVSQNGEKRSKLRVRAETVKFVGSPARTDQPSRDGQPVSVPTPPPADLPDDTDDIPF